MAKYSYEFKRKLVIEYLSTNISFNQLSRKYNIPNRSVIRSWVHNYNTFGKDALLRRKSKEIYTYEFKLNAVELYLTTELSQTDVCKAIGITNVSMLCRWINEFRTGGCVALKPKRKGRAPTMNKKHIPADKAKNKVSTDSEQLEALKKLEEENKFLRIEIAYLKEIRRLNLESDATTKMNSKRK